MIVRRLRVSPFGFFADREVRFLPGLNVVVGPNEAGKSTLFHAIRSSLLRTKMPRNKFAQLLERFLPAGGGDTLRVELEFEAQGGAYLLRRKWGPHPASELTLPGGGSLTDEDAVSAKLESILPARPGTFWKVLMTGQAELMATIDSLKKEASDSLSDLDNTLRAAVLETGGVSVDRFRELLSRELARSDSRWDAARGAPEDGRGIERPWKKEVGEILAACYARETATAAHRAARRHEDELDGLNAALRQASADAADAQRFLSDNGKAAGDARERIILEARLQAIRAGAEKLKRAGREWPVSESRAAELQKAIASLEERRPVLERERDDAARAEKARKLAERLQRISRRAAALKKAREKLAGFPSLDRKELEKIREASRAVELLQKGAESGRLSVTVTAKEDLVVSVQQDNLPAGRRELQKGKTESFEAAGRLRITHQAMEMEVRSADADSERLRRELADGRRRLEALLAAKGVKDPAEAEERCCRGELLGAELEAAERGLEEELAGETLDSMEKLSLSLGPVVETRASAEIEKDLARLEAEIEGKKREREELLSRIAEWRSEYGTAEKLIDALADSRRGESDLSARIAACAPLPDGFPDASSLIREFEKMQAQAEGHASRRTELLLKKAELEGRAPDVSAEELSAQVEEANARFLQASRRGEALRRVSAVAGRLLEKSDSAVFAGLRGELERIVSSMTADRYRKVPMDGSLPSGLEAESGTRLSWDMLSAGTKDVLALALRLAMAAHFLGEAPGFLMMDDPLVDMDPVRQEAAARALSLFAQKRQLLLFTCHPRHAELFGGNRIEL